MSQGIDGLIFKEDINAKDFSDSIILLYAAAAQRRRIE